MNQFHRIIRHRPFHFIAFILLGLSASPAWAVDWTKVDGKDVGLFYPGQASWEWVLTQADHSGAKKFRGGKTCRGCHEGEQADMGNLILSGKKLDPAPYPLKNGSIMVNVKTAHDTENLYVRLEWADQPSAGRNLDVDFETKITLMFDDGNVVEAARAGCWGACHDDANGMASSSEGQDLKKYLARSRNKITRSGGGTNYKSDDDTAKMYTDGIFLEYWQGRLNKGAPAVAVDGYLLRNRQEHAAPEVDIAAQFEDGKWVVVMSRKLIIDKAGYKNIVAGKSYVFGIAIHDAHATGRYHRISFEQTLKLDAGSSDFIALIQ